MVLQKRLDYGFNGYQVPPTPRAARSVRRRCALKTKADDNQMCAFDLLATVAGKLLSEGENSPPSVDVKQPSNVEDSVDNNKEQQDEGKLLEEEKTRDQDRYERNFLFTELVSEAKLCSNELPCPQNDANSRPASDITTSGGSEKMGSAEEMAHDDCKLRLGLFTPTVDVESSGFRQEDESRKQIKVDSANGRNLSINSSRPADLNCSGFLDSWERKPSALVSSVDSVKFPFCKGGPFPINNSKNNQNNVKLVNRDDDENSSECTEPSTRNRAFRPMPRVGDRRIRKLLSLRHGKVASNVKDEDRYNADTERFNYLNRKNGLKRQRSLRDYPIKKRKLYDCSSVSNSDERNGSQGICSVPENGANGGLMDSGLTPPGVIPTPTSASGERASFQSRNSQVKLRIKSFRVPELFIEIPENATVGSLKRTVMEAVNAVLGGGLRVGVVLQGRKIRDDTKTLVQAGIHDNRMDSLGFTLEPTPPQAPMRLCPTERQTQQLLRHDCPQPLASRYPPTPSITQNAIQQRSLDINVPEVPGTNTANFIESDHDSAPSPPDMPLQKVGAESKALIPMPTTKPDALAVVPLRKSKRSGSAQRRIRRPFTVAEVEALVQAVEKLGTGRWRDVKLRAFDHAKHRTYVDLKDKWKTLVHTARISPQQRRGEPVPQELLDRVLTAHAYWSQQQAKQQLKSQPDTSLLL